MTVWNKGIEIYRNKKVLVLGAARSGISAAHLLLKLGASVVLNDRNKPKADENWEEELRSKGAEVILGGHPEDLLDQGFDVIIKNPGIPYSHIYLQEAEKRGIPVYTEIELGYSIMEGTCIGITGSNGKTTTTTLTGEMITRVNRKTVLAGNIGKVFCEQVQLSDAETVFVTELSSFQLKGIESFRPKIACLLNIYPHHLDYHITMDDYIASKLRLFKNQGKEDYAVLNWDQDLVWNLGGDLSAQVYYFSRLHPVPQGAYIKVDEDSGERWILFKQLGQEAKRVIKVSEIALLGEHNLENILASITISFLAGVPKEDVVEVLRTFRGLEHRLEFVAEKSGVRYYNDSKATNPEATERALQSFKEPVILIAGGLERGENFDSLIPLLSHSVKGIVLYGETKERLRELAQRAGLKEIHLVNDVKEGVEAAAGFAEPGDVVLLSPACASWDLYSSFEERGRIFKQAVHTL